MDRREQWVAKLDSQSTDKQIEALRQISNQQDVTGLTTRIVRLSGSRDDDVRMWAAEALESAVQPTVDDVGELVGQLQTADDGEICYWAATLLGRLGRDAVAAVDALQSCLRDSLYLPAREQATWALCQIGPPASSAAPVLREVVDTAPPRLQRMANAALQAIGEAA